MKIRNGYIGNSSTASFVVTLREQFLSAEEPDKPLLTEEKIDDLKRIGFSFIPRYHHPTSIEEIDWSDIYIENCRLDKAVSAVLKVMCNEDDVIVELIRSKIPFKAVRHYGQYFIEWDGEEDSLLEVTNLGRIVEMYGREALDDSEETIKRISIVDYLSSYQEE